MNAFSDQIRDAIEASCVSRFALAEQAGIAESAISRFLSGKQGLSLSSLDKIAEVLGLQVLVGVQKVRKNRKRGRPKKDEPRETQPKEGERKMQKPKKMTWLDWGQLALDAAKEANEKNFKSRRGLYVVENVGIVYYDNNPFKLPPEKDRREELITRFRTFLRNSAKASPSGRAKVIGRPLKLQEKASAYYPTFGKEKGYTFVMVISGPDNPHIVFDAVRIVFQNIINDFLKGK